MLLREYGEAIEADLLHYYGGDLLDLWRGVLTPRRVLVLIKGLPPGSALHRARGGDAFWSDEVAAIKSMGHRLETTIIAVNGGNRFPKAPEPPPVGWQVDAARREARFAAKVARFKARTAARQQAEAAQQGADTTP